MFRTSAARLVSVVTTLLVLTGPVSAVPQADAAERGPGAPTATLARAEDPEPPGPGGEPPVAGTDDGGAPLMAAQGAASAVPCPNKVWVKSSGDGVVSFDPWNPAAGATAVPYRIGSSSMVYNNADGKLYGMTNRSADTFQVIDPETGASTNQTVSGSPVPIANAIAVVAGGGPNNRIYVQNEQYRAGTAIGTGVAQIYTVDSDPASPTYLRALSRISVGAPKWSSLVYSPTDGHLYGLSPNNNGVYRINPATGSIVQAGTTSLRQHTSGGFADEAGNPVIFDYGDKAYRIGVSPAGYTGTTDYPYPPGVQNVRAIGGCMSPQDFGDAPDTYPTSAAADGPRNLVRPGLSLGPGTSAEGDARKSGGRLNGLGDTLDDAITTAPSVLRGTPTYAVPGVQVNVPTGQTATLAGWVDLNGNGTFEPAERSVVQTVPAGSGTRDLTWTAPGTAKPGVNFLRLRLIEGDVADPQPGGAMLTAGETEDYPFTVQSPALKVTVAATPPEAQPPGGRFTAKITVVNRGDGQTTGPMTVTVPLGGKFTPGAGLPADCVHNKAAGAIVCTLTGTVAAGGTKYLDLPLRLAQSAALNSTQTTEITAVDPGEGPPTADNKAVLTKPVAVTVVSVWKVAATPVTPGTVRPDWPADVDVRVENEGPSDAAVMAPLTVTVPPGTTVDTTRALPADCRATNTTTVTCAPTGRYPSDAVKIFRIPVRTPGTTFTDLPGGTATAGGSTAAFALKTGDWPLPNFTLTAVSPDPIQPGGRQLMGASVTNNGPGDARSDVTVNFTVPAGVALGAAPGCRLVGRMLSCVIPKTQLAEGAMRTLFPPVTAPADAPLGVTLTGGVVQLDYPGGDLVAADNTARFDVKITPTAVTVPAVTVNPGRVVAPGEDTSVMVTVTNNGPAVARPPTTVTIVIPPHTTLVTPPPGCTLLADKLTCVITGILSVGDGESFDLSLRVDPDVDPEAVRDQELPGKVTVAGTAVDPAGGNNTVDYYIKLTTRARSDLQITGVNPADSVQPGADAEVTLTVKNAGPSNTATDSTVTVALPAGTTAVAYPSGCVPSATQLVCTVGRLAVGAEVKLPLTLAVAPEAPLGQTLSGLAVVVGTRVNDPESANNTFTVTVQTATTGLSDLWVQVPDPAQVAPGAEVELRVSVTNLGPSATGESATLTVTLPLKTTPAREVPGCSVTGRVLTCQVDEDTVRLAGAVFVIPVRVAADAVPGVALTGGQASVAFATTPAEDPDSTNDSVSFEITPGAAKSDLGVGVAGRPRMFRR